MSIFENQAIEIEKSCTKNNGGMKMKALASDFDRTLFFYDESGSYYRLEDVQAIKHFQSLGNLFGVCTGRSYKGIEDFNPHQIDYDFYILCSGAKILDKEGNLIYQKFIDKKIAQSIYEQYEAVDTSIVYQGDMYVLNRTFDLSPRVNMAAIGDSWNDIPMLKSVENSFTFNRSHQTVKNVAKYLVDGIDGCIEELIKCHK